MKQPEECASIDDIRAEIDRIDQHIIALIGERARYVRAAAKFKTSRSDVKAPDRVKAMLHRRRAWAQEQGLDPDMVEKLYRDLVNHFIGREMDHWKRKESQ